MPRFLVGAPVTRQLMVTDRAAVLIDVPGWMQARRGVKRSEGCSSHQPDRPDGTLVGTSAAVCVNVDHLARGRL